MYVISKALFTSGIDVHLILSGYTWLSPDIDVIIMYKLSLGFYNIAFTACLVPESDNRGASETSEGALVKCRCNEPKEQLLSTTLTRITICTQGIIRFASHYFYTTAFLKMCCYNSLS